MISSTLLALTMGAGLVQAKPIEIPFQIASNWIIVEALVNGKKANLIFDTGFSAVVIMGDHLNLGKITGTQTMQDFVGTVQFSTVAFKSLSVGGFHYKNKDSDTSIAQMPYDGLLASREMHMDGLLGMRPFNDVVLEINYQKKKMVVHPNSLDITKWKPDNKRTFLLNMLPYGVDHIILETHTSEGKVLRLALDTGNAHYITSHKDSIERVGLWKPGRKADFMGSAGVASGSVDSFDLLVENSKIYGVPVTRGVWNIIDRPAAGAKQDGTVGHDFLKNFNVYIDCNRRVVWLDNWAGKAAEEPVGSTGAGIGYFAAIKKFVVGRVAPKSPAEKAGIKMFDVVIAIDDQDIKGRSGNDIRKLLEGPVGSKVKLSVSRGGNLLHFDLERKLLVNTVQK